MKKKQILAVALMGVGMVAVAQTSVTDTVALSEIEVLATRASSNTPVAFTNMSKKQIEAVNNGKDIPFLLANTPSVLTTSDAGAGVGYSSMRVRGTDATRINITVNDIPMNDAESHSIYWVNTPDFASSLQDIQVQRGVGTSTNGSGAFGASVIMLTQRFSSTAYGEISGSYGSFNTQKETVKLGTGLMGDHWAMDARFSHIASDGYRDRASSKLLSYYAQLGYFGGGTALRFITFGGKETTYHAWDGISRSDLTENRTYNPNGEIKRDGKVIGFYDDQTDNYRQTHYQLIWDQGFGANWHWNLGLHYTDGFGFYQEYKNARTLQEYKLEPFYIGETKVKKSSLVRKKNVDSGFGGAVFSLTYSKDALNTTFGGSFNSYANDHYGNVLWVGNYLKPLDPSHEYYCNKGKKNDFNLYWKANYNFTKAFSVYADVQYRHIGYKITGENDKWDWTASPEHLQVLDINENFDFFNPKAGLNYRINENGQTVDSEIEKVLYDVFTAHNWIDKSVTFDNFIDRDNRVGGSIISSQKVGASIAEDITYGAIWSVILALIAIFIYILIRFRNVAFSIGSITALAFDTFLIIGIYSLLWGIVPWSLEVDQTFIGAILTAIGYSINDKVVIFDRIREELKKYPNRERQRLFNDSLNITLARTINTSVSTLIVLLCIFFLGGEAIRSFAFAMILGVIYGTCLLMQTL